MNESQPVYPLHALTLCDLEESLTSMGQPSYRAKQVMEWAYGREKRVESWDAMSNLPASLRSSLEVVHPIRMPEVVTVSGSKDTTRKLLLRLHDGELIETVLIPASFMAATAGRDRLPLRQ
jgi:23S rRNA (adenine2503-C2)-methyltransferase